MIALIRHYEDPDSNEMCNIIGIFERFEDIPIKYTRTDFTKGECTFRERYITPSKGHKRFYNQVNQIDKLPNCERELWPDEFFRAVNFQYGMVADKYGNLII